MSFPQKRKKRRYIWERWEAEMMTLIVDLFEASMRHLRGDIAWNNNIREGITLVCHNSHFNQFIQLLGCVRLFVTPWNAACQASLSITNSRSLLKLMSIELVMPSNHLSLCRPLLLPTSIFPSIWVFSQESVFQIRWPNYWSVSFSISPSDEYSGLISFTIDCFDFL